MSTLEMDNMNIYEVVERLKDEGYSIQLIAKQAGINYFRLYRAMNDGSPLKDDEIASIMRFALVQPCMHGVVING